jgi:hypothetical protein
VYGLKQQLQATAAQLQLLRQTTLGGSQNYIQVAGAVLARQDLQNCSFGHIAKE